MPNGGTISVSAENRQCEGRTELGLPTGQYVVLRVEDDGTGIPAELLHQVMEPFFTTKEVGKGTGLGLSMVHGFANQSGGALAIESEVGRGTIVKLWLPRAPDIRARAPEASALPILPTNATEAPLRILLVDDHAGVRATTAALLADLGHEVIEASDGPAVLEILEHDPTAYDLIISDYAMPVVSGIEVIRKARMLCPGMPALIVTGYAEVETIRSRPDDVPVLMKPFDQKQLSAFVQSATLRVGRSPG